jgi:hypothetical protein
MKTIIAGSRWVTDVLPVHSAIELSGFNITEVVSGCARGVDAIGEMWAAYWGVPVKPFPAAWRDKDGATDMQAGRKRNSALIAVWDGRSHGTKHMIDQANYYGLKHIYVYSVRPASTNKPKVYKTLPGFVKHE